MLRIGEIVRTSYDTGPYRIVGLSEPCTCPHYLHQIEGDDTPSETHYHLTCVDLNGREAWLGGYRADGTNVWSDDQLIFDGIEAGCTPDLFAVT